MQASAVRGFAGVDSDEPFFGRWREAVGTPYLHVDTSLICVALVYLGTFAHAYISDHFRIVGSSSSG